MTRSKRFTGFPRVMQRGPCLQSPCLFCVLIANVTQPPGAYETSLGDTPDLRRCLGWMSPPWVPSITAFKSCMKSEVCVSAGVGRCELSPESSKELLIVSSRIETKSFPTHCPKTRFGSGASLYPTPSTLPTLPLMEALLFPGLPQPST